MLITQLPCDCSVSSLAVPKAPTGTLTTSVTFRPHIAVDIYRMFAILDWDQGRGEKFQLRGDHQQLRAVLERYGGGVWGSTAHWPSEQPGLHRLCPVRAWLLWHLLQAGRHLGLPDVRTKGRQCPLSHQWRGSLL